MRARCKDEKMHREGLKEKTEWETGRLDCVPVLAWPLDLEEFI